MTTKVPNYLLLAGFLIYAFLVLKEHLIHDLYPGNVFINTICIVTSSALLSAAIFTALYVFFTATTAHKQFLGVCFAGSTILLLMFFYYYVQYTYINRALSNFESFPNVLPDLVERTRIDDSEDRREKWAHMAYTLYGARLSYRRESGDWVYYDPTQEDQNNYQNRKKIDISVKELRRSSRGLLSGDVDIIYTVFITFFFGLIWLALKRPSLEKASNLGM